MKVAWIDDGSGSGPVALGGINREARVVDGESELIITSQQLNYTPDFMNPKFYQVVNGVFSKKEVTDIDTIVAEDELEVSLANKLEELQVEMQSRIDAAVPQSNSKKDIKLVSRQLKLLNKKFDGRANVNELAELEASEALDDFLDAVTDVYDDAEAWLNSVDRLKEEIDSYDVKLSPMWP